MTKRRKEERQMGIASRGMVRRLGRCFSRVRHRGVADRERVPQRCHASGSVSDCVEMYQNGQDENVAFFWHQICRGTRLGASEPLTTARDTKNMDQKAFFSLWMPRRKSPIFKLPVLIQFQVAADSNSYAFDLQGVLSIYIHF